MNIYLIGLGVAAIVYWWLARQSPATPSLPDDITPARKNRFEAIEACWYTVAGLADQDCFKQNEDAQAAIATLKNIVVEELKR